VPCEMSIINGIVIYLDDVLTLLPEVVLPEVEMNEVGVFH